LGKFLQLFCFQRRHVVHTNFGTSGLANSITADALDVSTRLDVSTGQRPSRRGVPGGATITDAAQGAGMSRLHASTWLKRWQGRGLEGLLGESRQRRQPPSAGAEAPAPWC